MRLEIEQGDSPRYGFIHKAGCRDLVDGMPIGDADNRVTAEFLADDATGWDMWDGEQHGYMFAPCVTIPA